MNRAHPARGRRRRVRDRSGGTELTQAGAIAGGGLIKAGAGTLILEGANSYTGGTAIAGGVLEIDRDAPRRRGRPAELRRRHAAHHRRRRDGPGHDAGGGRRRPSRPRPAPRSTQAGGHRRRGRADQGRRRHDGADRHRRPTPAAPRSPPARCSSATAAPAARSPATSPTTACWSSTARTPRRSTARSRGTGALRQAGTAAPRLCAASTATPARPTVAAGALYRRTATRPPRPGRPRSRPGATLGGTGTIGGDVTIADGATLAPGDVGATPGTLTIAGRPRRSAAGSLLAYSFGQANVPGGAAQRPDRRRRRPHPRRHAQRA